MRICIVNHNLWCNYTKYICCLTILWTSLWLLLKGWTRCRIRSSQNFWAIAMATVLVNMQDHQLDSKIENQPPQHINILEELLLALMGHSGDVFTDTSPTSKLKVAEPGRCTLITNEELSFIARPERSTISTEMPSTVYYRSLWITEDITGLLHFSILAGDALIRHDVVMQAFDLKGQYSLRAKPQTCQEGYDLQDPDSLWHPSVLYYRQK